MFGIFESLTKAVVGAVVKLPVAIVCDLATLPSSAYENRNPFGGAADAVADVLTNLDNASKP